MPLIAVSLVVFLSIVGIAVDVMRDVEAAHQLSYAAKSAGLYGLSLATDSNGGFTQTSAQNNIVNAITLIGNTSGWNAAQIGPVAGVWSAPVTFTAGNIQFVQNPNPQDSSDFFVQVTAQSAGQHALTQFFLPVLYMAWPAGTTTSTAGSVSLSKVVEVLGQPASRIGAGAPLGAQGSDANFVGFATFPVAISNKQFAAASSAGASSAGQLLIDCVSSKSAELTGAAPAGHVKGCFVNDGAGGGSGNYYGGASSLADVDQLESLLTYFGGNTPQPALPPSAVERGSTLAAFDPAGQAFISSQNTIMQALSALVGSKTTYMLPVLYNDPSFASVGGASGNTVAGFAAVRFTSAAIVNGTITLGISLQQSVPMRNASAVNGLLTTSPIGSNPALMPPPVAPFLPRQVDTASGGISARPLGVVFAPAVSPRQIVVAGKQG